MKLPPAIRPWNLIFGRRFIGRLIVTDLAWTWEFDPEDGREHLTQLIAPRWIWKKPHPKATHVHRLHDGPLY